LKGIVKFYDDKRKFGFIHTTDQDYFFHKNEWTLFTSLPVKGQWVSFDCEDILKGPIAVEIKPVVDA